MYIMFKETYDLFIHISDQSTKCIIHTYNDWNAQVRRDSPKSPGIYIQGSVNNVNCWFTVDTGASRTIVSNKIFKKINPNSLGDKKKSTVPLQQADGNPLPEIDNWDLQFKMNTLQISR